MPSALAWKALPTVNVATMSDVGYIAALKNLFDQPNYADGTARTGSPTAWTTSTLSDGSLKCTAPSNPLGLIAHFIPASLTANNPKSFGEPQPATTTGKVLGTIVLNPGTYTSNNANTWGASSRCFGYCQMAPLNITAQNPTSSNLSTGLISTYTSIAIRAWESADAVVIHVMPSTGVGAIYVLGGWIAPDISASESADAETDGVLYGIMTSGNSGSYLNNFNLTFYTYNYDVSPWINGTGTYAFTTNGWNNAITSIARVVHPHCGVFQPGTSNVVEINRMGSFKIAGSDVYGANYILPQQFVTISQKFIKIPLYFQSSTNFIGRAREMWMFRRSVNGLVLRSGGSGGQDKGHIVSFSNTASGDAFLLSV